MKILITGATGFIGKNLAERVIREGHDLTCGGRSFGKIGRLLDKAKTAYVELENKKTITEALEREKPDMVYHSAALIESGSRDKLFRVNRDGTRNVLSACCNTGVKKVVYLSTIAVVSGNPEVLLTEDLPYSAKTAYGESKIEAEKIALEYRKKGMKIAIIRPCMVYGENEPHGLERLINAIKKRRVPVFGKGDKKLQLVSVENLADILILCLTKEEAYDGIYYAADKEALTIKELFEYIAGIIGAKVPLRVPESIARILSVIPFVKKYMDFFLKDRLYSIDRLRDKLGYVPRVSVYDGLKRAILSYVT